MLVCQMHLLELGRFDQIGQNQMRLVLSSGDVKIYIYIYIYVGGFSNFIHFTRKSPIFGHLFVFSFLRLGDYRLNCNNTVASRKNIVFNSISILFVCVQNNSYICYFWLFLTGSQMQHST